MAAWILLNAALKGTIVLGAAWLLTALLRRKSAASRHLVWTAAAAAVLALPFLTIGLPTLRLPARAAGLADPTGIVIRAVATVAPEAPLAMLPATPTGRPSSGGTSRPSATGILTALWALGAAVMLLQMAAAYAGMWRKRRAARRFDDRGLAASLEIQTNVELLEAPAGSMPMVFGLLRPAIFLPADAAQWDEERLRMVLLHEFAHVRRGDLATHFVARTALSLHWWNPLAWIAWRAFVNERERAADDLVLNAGARASDYAGHLLAVARSMQSSPATAWAAVAMARRSQLEGRLVAILDGGVKRGASSRYAPLVAALLAVALVAPFAAVRAQNGMVAPELDATIRAANSQKNHNILDHAAKAYIDLYKYEEAQTLLENSLAIRGEVEGTQSTAYAVGLVKLGQLAEKRRQYADADQFYAKAVSLGDRAEVAPALLYLGIKANRAKNPDAAWEFFWRTIQVQPEGPIAGQALTWMALMRKGEPEAELLFQRALAAMDSNEPAAATTQELYSTYLRYHQRDSEADRAANLAREIRRNSDAGTAQIGLSGMKMSQGMTPPALIHKLEPEYSEEARAAKFQGTVLLHIDVGTDGKAQSIKVARSLGLGLDEKAIEAVRQWTFSPGRDADGIPVMMQATIEINFRLM